MKKVVVHPLDKWSDAVCAHDVCARVCDRAVDPDTGSSAKHGANIDVEVVFTSAYDNPWPLGGVEGYRPEGLGDVTNGTLRTRREHGKEERDCRESSPGAWVIRGVNTRINGRNARGDAGVWIRKVLNETEGSRFMWFWYKGEGRGLKGAEDCFDNVPRVWTIVPAAIPLLLNKVTEGVVMRHDGPAVGRGEGG